MKLNVKEKELENLENQSNVIPLSDVDQAGKYPDWLTPMDRLSKFVCVERDRFKKPTYLQAYTKLLNHEHCIELIEHFHGQEVPVYVFPREFCIKYQLIEIIDVYTGTV